jgi:hypothetical protein
VRPRRGARTARAGAALADCLVCGIRPASMLAASPLGAGQGTDGRQGKVYPVDHGSSMTLTDFTDEERRRLKARAVRGRDGDLARRPRRTDRGVQGDSLNAIRRLRQRAAHFTRSG